jgi:hypothetical protein
MSIAAKISSAELTALVTARYVGKYYETRLINSPGVSYTPGVTNDTTFLTGEVADGTGGYKRQVIYYSGPDVSAYGDDGVSMATKAVTFAHNGSATPLAFTHAALVEANGSVTAIGTATAKPSSGINGTYTNIPATVVTGSGKNLYVNLTITSAGAALANWVVTPSKPGYSFAVANQISLPESVLKAAGAIATSATGNLVLPISTVYSSSNQLFAVAQTTNQVSLTSGNETVIYWNLKQFGFHTV